MSAKKSKPPAAPPTMLVITLEANGNGALLARRGELAHLSQFSYRGMAEIIAAIQSGAVALGELEQNPPPAEVPPTQTATHAPESSAETPPATDETSMDEPAPANGDEVSDAPVVEMAESVTPTTPAQTQLF